MSHFQTPHGKWRVSVVNPRKILLGDGRLVAEIKSLGLGIEQESAIAARIVECVNACAGMEAPAKEIAQLQAYQVSEWRN